MRIRWESFLWPALSSKCSRFSWCVCVLVTQSCLILCDPMNYSLPGFSVHGILQARILEWVAIPFSRGSSGPGIECRSPALQADSLQSEPPGKPMYCLFSSCSLLLKCHIYKIQYFHFNLACISWFCPSICLFWNLSYWIF